MYSDMSVEHLFELHKGLKQERQPYNRLWQDIADLVLPDSGLFNFLELSREQFDQRLKTQRIFDATPTLSLQRFAAAVASLTTPKNQPWHGLKPTDNALIDNRSVKIYCDEITEILFDARSSSNFDTALQDCYTDAGLFGNSCCYVGEKLGKGLFYRHIPLYEMYWSLDVYGRPDVVVREFFMTAKEAYEFFGDETPQPIKDCVLQTPFVKFKFLHIVYPSRNIAQDVTNYTGMNFRSVYLSYGENKIVKKSGYHTMPYQILRFQGSGTYASSPCAMLLPDIKMLNQINKDVMQASALSVLPPLLTNMDINSNELFTLMPGAINYGGLDINGRANIAPLELAGNIPIGFEMMEQKRLVINDGLWNTMFQILVDSPQMTATEVMQRAQEKGALLAPAAGRIESEFLDPLISREIDLLARMGALPDAPPEFIDEEGNVEDVSVLIEYRNPLARARRQDQGAAIMRGLESLAAIANVAGNEVLSLIDPIEAGRKVLDVLGVPADIIRSDDEVQAIVEKLAADQIQQAQLQNMLAAAPALSSAAKDMSQAQAIAATVEGSQLPAMIPQ